MRQSQPALKLPLVKRLHLIHQKIPSEYFVLNRLVFYYIRAKLHFFYNDLPLLLLLTRYCNDLLKLLPVTQSRALVTQMIELVLQLGAPLSARSLMQNCGFTDCANIFTTTMGYSSSTK